MAADPKSIVQSPAWQKLRAVRDWRSYTVTAADILLLRELEAVRSHELVKRLESASDADLQQLERLVKKARGDDAALLPKLRRLLEQRRRPAQGARSGSKQPLALGSEGSGSMTSEDVVRDNMERQLAPLLSAREQQLGRLMSDGDARVWLRDLREFAELGDETSLSLMLAELGILPDLCAALLPVARELAVVRVARAVMPEPEVYGRGLVHTLSPKEPGCLPYTVAAQAGPRARLAYVFGAAAGYGLEASVRRRLLPHVRFVLQLLVG